MQGALTSLLREEGMAYHRLEFLGNDNSAECLEDDEGGGGGREGPLSPKQWNPPQSSGVLPKAVESSVLRLNHLHSKNHCN